MIPLHQSKLIPYGHEQMHINILSPRADVDASLVLPIILHYISTGFLHKPPPIRRCDQLLLHLLRIRIDCERRMRLYRLIVMFRSQAMKQRCIHRRLPGRNPGSLASRYCEHEEDEGQDNQRLGRITPPHLPSRCISTLVMFPGHCFAQNASA